MGKRPEIPLNDAGVLVTGAGSGIGRATALAFADRGARVLATDVDEGRAAKTAADCVGPAVALRLDVADSASVDEVAATVTAEHDPIDVLVNNAGVGMTGRFLDTRADDWRWILDINLGGVIACTRAWLPAMVERGRGQVVNVASGLAYTPRATEPAYVTTKAAVLALSRCLRADLAAKGVGVTAVCPGVINTAIVTDGTRFRGERADPESVEKVQRLFRKRGHPPELVGRAIVAAVERNPAVAPVGFEARLGWALNGLLPSALVDRLAGMDPPG